MPNPALLLRHGEDWQPVYESLNLAWVDCGCAGETPCQAQPVQLLGQLAEVATTPVSDGRTPSAP